MITAAIATPHVPTSFTETEISTIHAGCDIGLTVDMLPSRVTHTFTYEFNDAVHGHANVFDYVIAQNDFHPRTHYLYSPDNEPLDCTGMTAYIYDGDNTTTPLYSSGWEQMNVDTCRLNFDYKLTNEELSRPLTFINEMENVVSADARIDLLRTDHTLPKPENGVYTITSEVTVDYDAGLNGHLIFDVDVAAGYDVGCTPPTGITLDFINCDEVENPSIVGTNTAGTTWEFDIPVAYYARCAHSQKRANGMIIFDIEIDPIAALPACDSVTDQDDFTSNIFLRVELAEDVYSVDDKETTFTPLNLDVLQYGPDNTDDLRCNGRLLPLGLLTLTVRAQINAPLYQAQPTDNPISLLQHKLGEAIDLTILNTNCVDYGVEGSYEYCDFDLMSANCLAMELLEDGTCRFDHLYNLVIEFQAVLEGATPGTEGNTITKFLDYRDSKLSNERTYTSDQCPTIDNSIDATGQYDSVITVKDEFDKVDLVPEDDVIVFVEVPELANTQLHLVIETVVIQLDNGVPFVMDVRDKLSKMDRSSVITEFLEPFSIDGHFCSYYPVDESNTVSCPAFYNNVAEGDSNQNGERRWNSWADGVLADRFVAYGTPDVDEQWVLDYCDGIDPHGDKFIFNPKIWEMIPEGFTQGQFKIEAFAKLRLCSGTSYSGGAGRRLSDDEYEYFNETTRLLATGDGDQTDGSVGEYIRFDVEKPIVAVPLTETDAPTTQGETSAPTDEPDIPYVPNPIDCEHYNQTQLEFDLGGDLWGLWIFGGLFVLDTLMVVGMSVMGYDQRLEENGWIKKFDDLKTNEPTKRESPNDDTLNTSSKFNKMKVAPQYGRLVTKSSNKFAYRRVHKMEDKL